MQGLPAYRWFIECKCKCRTSMQLYWISLDQQYCESGSIEAALEYLAHNQVNTLGHVESESMINGGMSGLCMESGRMWRNKLVLPHVNRWQHTDVAHAILIAPRWLYFLPCSTLIASPSDYRSQTCSHTCNQIELYLAWTIWMQTNGRASTRSSIAHNCGGMNNDRTKHSIIHIIEANNNKTRWKLLSHWPMNCFLFLQTGGQQVLTGILIWMRTLHWVEHLDKHFMDAHRSIGRGRPSDSETEFPRIGKVVHGGEWAI